MCYHLAFCPLTWYVGKKITVLVCLLNNADIYQNIIFDGGASDPGTPSTIHSTLDFIDQLATTNIPKAEIQIHYLKRREVRVHLK